MFKFSDIIEEVSEFNTDLKYGLDDIIGVTIEKGLIPTVANLAQTALNKFYIVRPNTFIYNPRTHGVRLGMGFNETDNVYITSWNNVAFKVKKSSESLVLPKYLWLYFLRPDWDRLSNFLAWGSSTIVFSWTDFLNVEIALPSIETQRQIVAEYNAIQTRIDTNKKFIATLEQTAQTLYRHTFVDNIDPNNLPEGWRIGVFTDLVQIGGGGTPSTSEPSFWNDEVLFFTPADVNYAWYTIDTIKKISNKGLSSCSSKLYAKNTTFVTARGTVGSVGLAGFPMAMNQSCFALLPKYGNCPFYIHQLSMDTMASLKEEAIGAVFNALTSMDFQKKSIIIPPEKDILQFDHDVELIYRHVLVKQQENQTLTQMQTLLLSKMGA